jgi:hypothetical protein
MPALVGFGWGVSRERVGVCVIGRPRGLPKPSPLRPSGVPPEHEDANQPAPDEDAHELRNVEHEGTGVHILVAERAERSDEETQTDNEPSVALPEPLLHGSDTGSSGRRPNPGEASCRHRQGHGRDASRGRVHCRHRPVQRIVEQRDLHLVGIGDRGRRVVTPREEEQARAGCLAARTDEPLQLRTTDEDRLKLHLPERTRSANVDASIRAARLYDCVAKAPVPHPLCRVAFCVLPGPNLPGSGCTVARDGTAHVAAVVGDTLASMPLASLTVSDKAGVEGSSPFVSTM